MTWRATVLTLFPEMFPGPLGVSLAGRALERKLWSLETVNIRDFATDRHRSVDDEPFGGGPGMVMRPDIVEAALLSTVETVDQGVPILYLSPRGIPLTQPRIRNLAEGSGAVMLCGRYEGVDARVIAASGIEEVSLGDFVLSGGEIAAIAMLDAVVRVLPGVIGDAGSLEEESFETGLLEYPQYTRPEIWTAQDGTVHAVPDVLMSGHHGNIAKWRRRMAEHETQSRRPDLWEKYIKSRSSGGKEGGGMKEKADE